MSTSNATVPRFIARRRWWVLPLLVWAAVVGGELVSHLDELKERSQLVAVEGARNMFRMVVLMREWNAQHGGVYLPVDDKLQPNPYLEDPRRDLVTPDGQVLTLVNPAYMTRLVAELAKSHGGAAFHITSLRPIRPANQADEWERKALLSFEAGAMEAIEVLPVEGGGGRKLRYMAPLYVTKACLSCHAKQGYSEGEIRGGISVTTSYLHVDNAVGLARQNTTINHLAIFLLGAIAGLGLLELLRQRWFKLGKTISELEATRSDLDLSNQNLRQARYVAEAANMAKSEFLANMSHELRTPLNAISGFSHLLKHRIADPHMLGNIEQIQKASGRLLEMIQQLLNLSKAETGKLEQAIERFEVSALAQEAFALLQASTESKGLSSRLVIDSAAMPCWLYGDRQHIFDVLKYFLANAVKFSEQGEISLVFDCTLAEDGRTRLHIEVQDQGIGIASEHLPNLFNLFQQVDGSATRRHGGNGIGLILCKRLAEVMGGEVGVASGLGEGSRFWLDLQLGQQPGRSEA